MQACPVSLESIDTNVVRLTAFFTSVSAMLFLAFDQALWVGLLLMYDFSVRLLRLGNISPFLLLAKGVVTLLSVRPKYTDAKPKRFALALGTVFVAVMITAAFFDWKLFASVAAFVLFLCALFEALFDFCIGCKIYYLLKLLKVI